MGSLPSSCFLVFVILCSTPVRPVCQGSAGLDCFPAPVHSSVLVRVRVKCQTVVFLSLPSLRLPQIRRDLLFPSRAIPSPQIRESWDCLRPTMSTSREEETIADGGRDCMIQQWRPRVSTQVEARCRGRLPLQQWRSVWRPRQGKAFLSNQMVKVRRRFFLPT